MATFSEVKTGLDQIADVIRQQRQVVLKAISNAGGASAALAALPENFADVIATINGYGTSDAAEANVKAEFAKLTNEFVSLKGNADAIAAVDL